MQVSVFEHCLKGSHSASDMLNLWVWSAALDNLRARKIDFGGLQEQPVDTVTVESAGGELSLVFKGEKVDGQIVSGPLSDTWKIDSSILQCKVRDGNPIRLGRGAASTTRFSDNINLSKMLITLEQWCVSQFRISKDCSKGAANWPQLHIWMAAERIVNACIPVRSEISRKLEASLRHLDTGGFFFVRRRGISISWYPFKYNHSSHQGCGASDSEGADAVWEGNWAAQGLPPSECYPVSGSQHPPRQNLPRHGVLRRGRPLQPHQQRYKGAIPLAQQVQAS